MERKIQNSELSRHAGANRNCRKNGKRANSENAVIKNVGVGNKADGASDDLEDDAQTNRSSQTLNSENSGTQTSEEMPEKMSEKTKPTTKRKISYSSSTSTPRGRVVSVGGNKNSEDNLKAELKRYKRELDDYNHATRELEQKYMKINIELGAMQQKHQRFLANRNDCSRTCSDYSLQRKFTQVFQRGKSFLMHNTSGGGGGSGEPNTILSPSHTSITGGEQLSSTLGKTSMRQHKANYSTSSKCRESNCSKDTIYFETPTATSSDVIPHKHYCVYSAHTATNLNRLYDALQQAMNSSERKSNLDGTSENIFLHADDSKELQKIIAQLHDEQMHFRSVIEEQQTHLQDYQQRCQHSKRIMETQQCEIEKLTANNKVLKQEIDIGLDKLRQQLDTKLREMAPLSQKLCIEQTRYDKLAKENQALVTRVRNLQTQSKELKQKLEELNKRKTSILDKLKNAERDLRVYRNYNTALKTEKSRQVVELQKLREQLETQQAASKRVLARQRDQSDKQCRELQRRIYDLEQKLGRSNNSTSGLLLQRDRLITELQTQINTLVHNFEVSQKHIRVLRRQVINAAGQSGVNSNNNNVGIPPPSGLRGMR